MLAGTRPFLNAGSVIQPVPFGNFSIAVSGQGRADAIGFDLASYCRAAEIPFTFVAFPRGQVASPGRTMLNLARGRESETFLCALMGLQFRHLSNPSFEDSFYCVNQEL